MHHPSRTARRALPSTRAPRRKRGTAHPRVSGTRTHCPPRTAVQTLPHRAEPVPPRGAAALHGPSTLRRQAQHLPSAAQSLGNPTPCAGKHCSLRSLQTHSSFPCPATPDWDTAHPAPQGQPRAAHPVPMPTPPAAVTEVLPPCIAETHTAHAAPQAPGHWKPPPSMHTLQRQCQAHRQPQRGCPLLRQATCPVTNPLPSPVPGHQLSRPPLSIRNTPSSSRVQAHPCSFCRAVSMRGCSAPHGHPENPVAGCPTTNSHKHLSWPHGSNSLSPFPSPLLSTVCTQPVGWGALLGCLPFVVPRRKCLIPGADPGIVRTLNKWSILYCPPWYFPQASSSLSLHPSLPHRQVPHRWHEGGALPSQVKMYLFLEMKLWS